MILIGTFAWLVGGSSVMFFSIAIWSWLERHG